MKGILKNTKAGWFVLYQVMRDEITSGYDSIPLHPDSQTWMDGYHLYEGKEVQFEIVMDKPDHTYSQTPYAKTIDEDVLGCSYPNCICQGDEITYCNNRTPEQVVLGDKTALVEDVFHQGIEKKHSQQVDFSNPNADKITSNTTANKLSFRERCRIGNYTPFNIENLMGELSKKKKENYLTQEEFEEFHNTIMDGLNIPRYEK